MNRYLMIPARALSVTLTIIGLMLFASCEKEVHIKLESAATRPVVQGEIETGKPPYVLITSTMGFFSKIDLGTLQNTFIHNAVVKISDGTKTVQLREYTVDSGSFRFSFYTLDTSGGISNLMFGENGNTYTLSIDYEGNNYSAVTKIPNPQGFDTMWFDLPDFSGPNTPDSARQLFVNYTDPDTPGDYVRCYTSRDVGQPFYYSANFSDEVINGKVISNIGLAAGYESTGADRNRDSLIYFFPGETVTLKWCAVDKGVYTFWNTLDFAMGAVGNPFASPINPTTNLTNGAVGVWAGYGVFSKTAVVPHR